VLEPKIGKMKCPECNSRFQYDHRMERIFVDTEDLRLPNNVTVCPQFGSLQSEDIHCGHSLSLTVQ